MKKKETKLFNADNVDETQNNGRRMKTTMKKLCLAETNYLLKKNGHGNDTKSMEDVQKSCVKKYTYTPNCSRSRVSKSMEARRTIPEYTYAKIRATSYFITSSNMYRKLGES